MNTGNINGITRKRSVIIEIVIGLCAVAFLVYLLRSMLLYGETTLLHDNIYGYPFFQYFAENIINGNYPFWNPFSNGGEPFYPIISLQTYYEPITLLTIYIGSFITDDIVMIFNWHKVVKILFMLLGVYIVLRLHTKHLFIRLSLIPILLYSSFLLVSFHANSSIKIFFWVPWITYFLLSIIWYKDYRWFNWIILAALVGLNWQSYWFVGPWTFIFFFFLYLTISRRDLLKELFKTKGFIPRFSVTSAIVLLMMAPNIVLLLEKGKFVFPARMMKSVDDEEIKHQQAAYLQYEGKASNIVEGINMPYSVISQTGTFSTIWDFIQLISPDGNKFIEWPDMKRWGKPSEAYMYLGLLPWAIALLGIVMGKHELKRLWLLILIGFGLLMLGPPGGVHKVLYYVYPPIWFIRHTHLFVLFFVFAFLYFYVLGFNYIFSTWHGNLFTSDTEEGAPKRSLIIAFSACIVASLYWMTQLEYPRTDYLFVCFIFLFIIGWFLRKGLGKKGLYISLIMSHIAVVVILTPNTFRFCLYTFFVFGIPLSIFLYIKKRTDLSNKAKYGATIILFTVFAICLTGDLIYSFKQSKKLYLNQSHPGLAYNINTKVQKLVLPHERFIMPNSIYCTTGQSMRLPSLVYRQPYVFSPLYPGHEYPDIDEFGILTKTTPDFVALNNITFESWIKMQDGGLLPEHSTYYQDGNGGTIERYTLEDGVRDGKYSVLLKPSSKGNSFLRLQTKNINELKGQSVVKLSMWVKSQNKTPDAIQLDIQDGTGVPSLKSYGNSGNWERIEVLKYIDEAASGLFVTCNVKHDATTGAYIDGIAIEAASMDPFVYALNSKRWNSLLLPRKYFELINSGIPPLAMKDMFATGKPVFQFKHGAVAAEDGEAINLLKRLGEKDSVQLLEDYVIVDSQINPSDSKLIVPVKEYGKRSRAGSSTGGENSGFTFSTNRYDYNNIDMKVLTDKDGILYWSDGYDKWWKAYINGKKVPIYRANIDFKAIALPKGESNVRFVYKPVLFIISLFVFYGSLIMSSVAVLVTSINYRKVN